MSKPLDFPIPFPGQAASDDLGTARLLLSAVVDVMADADHLDSARVQSLFSVLYSVSTKLEIIQLFLDDLECPDQEKQYQAARRLWTLQNAGQAVAS